MAKKKLPVPPRPKQAAAPVAPPQQEAAATEATEEEFVAMTHDPMTGEAHWFSPVSGDRILAMQELDPRKAQAIATAIAHASQIAWQVGRQELYRTVSHTMTRALGFTGKAQAAPAPNPDAPGATNVIKKP